MKKLSVIFAALLLATSAFAARYMESLNRGVVAARINTNSVYVGWRMLGTDPSGISFNVYRGGVKVNATPIANSTNYTDNTAASSAYYVKPVIGGIEQPQSETANTWAQFYMTIPMTPPAMATMPDGVTCTYNANDCSAADLDGDGEYEIIVKWDPTNSKDNSQAGYTGNVFLDAYKLNGTRLWRIDLGINIRAGAHYTQFMVYDLNSDGRAELACKTAPGSKDSSGAYLSTGPAASDTDNSDYRNTSGYILSGPEYLTVFNGASGREITTVNYNPPRGTVSSWGDSYGNRVDRFLACVAYLDGTHPSLVMCRGYYTRAVLVAYDFSGTALTQRWIFDSNAAGNGAYAGEGNHNLSVADVDNDGKDEIIYGSCAINDNGTGMYATNLGHGDANHLGNMDPDRAGLEYFQPHEEYPQAAGAEYRDPATGALLWGYPSTADVGRGLAADIDGAYRGWEMWASNTDGVYNVNGTRISTTKPSVNFRIYWDGDLQDELLDGTKLDKWTGNGTTRLVTIYNFAGASENNGTKANPGLTADILGDWREEMVYRNATSTNLIIFTTTTMTNYRFYTLMHDLQYRLSVAWQNVAYNQPPHVSFYLADGPSAQPAANIQYPAAGVTNTYTATRTNTATFTLTATSTFTYTFTFTQVPTATQTETPAYNCPMVFDEEFNGPNIDTNKWVFETGAGGWGNNELEYYTNLTGNARIENGQLVIEARNETYGGSNYTSARLKTEGKFSYKYGRVEAKIKLPYGQGIWPAFWMLGDNIGTVGWPACGEIDIMEMIGGGENRDDTLYGTAHWEYNGHASYGGNTELPDPQFFYQAYHVFGIEWTPTYIRWYLDGVQYHVIDITPADLSELHNNYFILLNLAVGGNWPGSPDGSTVFPQKMYVDWVRWYDCTASTSTPTNTYTVTRTNTPTGTNTFTQTATYTFTNTFTYTYTPTATQIPADYKEMQAEGVCSFDGIYETINAGYSGSSYLNLYNTTGSSVMFFMDAANAAGVTLFYRYSNGSANARGMRIMVNGITQAAPLAFASTGAWTAWQNEGVSVNLSAGRNEITIEALTAEGGPNIDLIYFVSTAADYASCIPPTESPTDTVAPSFTETPADTDTMTPVFTNTHTYTDTYTATYTNTAVLTFIHTATNTNTQMPATATPVNTATGTYTQTRTHTATQTLTHTVTVQNTPTHTYTATYTHTFTNTQTHTASYTFTPTQTQVPATFTQTPTHTMTAVPKDSDKQEIKTVIIYPQPYNVKNGSLKLMYSTTKRAGEIRIRLYSVSYRLLRDFKISGDTFAGIHQAEIKPVILQGLANGTYYFVIKDNTGGASKLNKIILLR